MFVPTAIGFVRSGYQQTADVPKGFGARHDVAGVLELQPEFEAGLTDIDGFSHLYVLWVFDRSDGFELLGTPPTDDRPAWRVRDAIAEASEPDRPVGRGVAAARRLPASCSRGGHAGRHADPGHQAVSVERAGRHTVGEAGSARPNAGTRPSDQAAGVNGAARGRPAKTVHHVRAGALR